MERRDARAAHGRVLRGPRALGVRARVRARLRRPAGRVGRGAAAAPSARRHGRRPLGAPQDGGGSRPRRLRGARPGQDRARGDARPARRDGARRPSRGFSPAGPARSRRARDGSPRRRRLPRRDEDGDGRDLAARLRPCAAAARARPPRAGRARLHGPGAGRARLGEPRPAPASRRRRDDERGGSRTALHHEARPPRRRLRAALPDLTPGAGSRLASPPAPGLAGRLPRRALRAQLRPRERPLLLRRLRARVHGVLRRAGLRAAAGERRHHDERRRGRPVRARPALAARRAGIVRGEPELPGRAPRCARSLAVGHGPVRSDAPRAVRAHRRRLVAPGRLVRLPAGRVRLG